MHLRFLQPLTKKILKKKIIKLCRSLKIDLVIPAVDEELEFFSEYKGVHSLVPQKSFVNTFNDKKKTTLILNKKNINHPKIYTLTDLQTNFRIYPIILKPRFGRGSRGIFVISNFEEFCFYKKKYNISSTKYIFQEYIKGTEYSVQVISDLKGNLKAVIPVEIINKKGITIDAIVSTNKKILRFCENFHINFCPRYVYNIQLIATKSKIYCIEVNPRISTTHILTLMHGIDPIEIFFNSKSSKRPLIKLLKIKLKRFHETYFS